MGVSLKNISFVQGIAVMVFGFVFSLSLSFGLSRALEKTRISLSPCECL